MPFPNFAPFSPANKYTSPVKIPLVDVPKLALPLRLKPIRGVSLGGLFNEYCKGVYDMCVPVFYNDNFIFGSKKKITCNIVEIDVMIVDIPKRWTRFFLGHRFFKYSIDNFKSNHYVGLLIHKVSKMFKKPDEFLIDLWRLDYFPFRNYEEESYEFYQIKKDFKDWPDASKNIISYLSPLQFEGIMRGSVMSFGILPRINLVNSNALYRGRKILKDIYLYGYNKLHKRQAPLISVGHGIFNPSKLKNGITVFQYDQVSPVPSQEFNFKDDVIQ